MKEFQNKNDIHNATAASIFDVEINAVEPEMRKIAKIMNFGVLYGLSPYGISQQTGLTSQQGQKFIEAYLFIFFTILSNYFFGSKFSNYI